MRPLKHFLLGSIFFVLSSNLYAQTAIITGVVVSENGTPISDAHIYLSPEKWAISDNYGAFEIQGISPGDYVLKSSNIMYRKYSQVISLEAGDALHLEIVMKGMVFEERPAVVTATRSIQDIEDVPISVDVISENEINNSGATSLKDLLLEQTGISLSPNESNAIQIQGFESDYTLIMIDGQPVIGRLRGALDVSRINVSNVQQIEIVKGPSSALWGSDALAGVINIITKTPEQPFLGTAYSEYGSRNTYDAGASVSFLKKDLSGSINASSDGSDGFDLSDDEFGQNQNPYRNYTLNSSLSYSISELTTVSLSGRYYRNSFDGSTAATVQNEIIAVDLDGWQDDASLNLKVDTSPLSKLKTTALLYSTRYEDYSRTYFTDPDEEDIINRNRQGLDKADIQNNYNWNTSHFTTFGGGLTREFVNAERYQGRRNQSGSFLFAQHQVFITDDLNMIAGLRLDNHSSYESYLSPKLAFKYNITPGFSLRASYGKGFKAPDFRTLYLDFDNAGSGYRIYGTKNISEQLQYFEEQGLLGRYIIDASGISSLEPEYSTAYNTGISFQTADYTYRAKVSGFWNNAQNLIEAVEIAELADQSTVYGYVNISKARTRGIETEHTLSLSTNFQITAGYQFLDAQQLVTEEKTVIENGQVVTKEVESEVPLPKRNKHSGTIKLFFRDPFLNTQWFIRGNLMGSYFYNDDNGNGTADSNEFADAYMIWNASVSRQFGSSLSGQLGVNNILNYTDPDYLRYQPGTSVYARLSYNF